MIRRDEDARSIKKQFIRATLSKIGKKACVIITRGNGKFDRNIDDFLHIYDYKLDRYKKIVAFIKTSFTEDVNTSYELKMKSDYAIAVTCGQNTNFYSVDITNMNDLELFNVLDNMCRILNNASNIFDMDFAINQISDLENIERIKSKNKNEAKKELKRFIRERLKEIKMTRRELCNTIGISESTYSRNLSKDDISMKFIVTLIRYLKIDKSDWNYLLMLCLIISMGEFDNIDNYLNIE